MGILGSFVSWELRIHSFMWGGRVFFELVYIILYVFFKK